MQDGFLDVSGLLEPKSVAVIGASDRPGNLGGDTVRRLTKFNYAGPIWPISRTSAEVAGLKAYPSIAEAPGVADLVVLGIPADGLIEAIRDASRPACATASPMRAGSPRRRRGARDAGRAGRAVPRQ